MERRLIGVWLWVALVYAGWLVTGSWAAGLVIATVLLAPAWDKELLYILKGLWTKL